MDRSIANLERLQLHLRCPMSNDNPGLPNPQRYARSPWLRLPSHLAGAKVWLPKKFETHKLMLNWTVYIGSTSETLLFVISASTLKALSKGHPKCSPIPSACRKGAPHLAVPWQGGTFASVRSRNCLSSGHLWRSAAVWVRPILWGSERQFIWVPVDHCVCGAQLHELLNMVKLQAKRQIFGHPNSAKISK